MKATVSNFILQVVNYHINGRILPVMSKQIIGFFGFRVIVKCLQRYPVGELPATDSWLLSETQNTTADFQNSFQKWYANPLSLLLYCSTFQCIKTLIVFPLRALMCILFLFFKRQLVLADLYKICAFLQWLRALKLGAIFYFP